MKHYIKEGTDIHIPIEINITSEKLQDLYDLANILREGINSEENTDKRNCNIILKDAIYNEGLSVSEIYAVARAQKIIRTLDVDESWIFPMVKSLLVCVYGWAIEESNNTTSTDVIFASRFHGREIKEDNSNYYYNEYSALIKDILDESVENAISNSIKEIAEQSKFYNEITETMDDIKKHGSLYRSRRGLDLYCGFTFYSKEEPEYLVDTWKRIYLNEDCVGNQYLKYVIYSSIMDYAAIVPAILESITILWLSIKRMKTEVIDMVAYNNNSKEINKALIQETIKRFDKINKETLIKESLNMIRWSYSEQYFFFDITPKDIYGAYDDENRLIINEANFIDIMIPYEEILETDN